MIRIGPAGWSYKDWEGIVYPSPAPRGFHGAEYLAQYFDTIEINSTFYRPPSADSGRAWAKRVSANRNFRYTAKLWRGFTHERNATDADEQEFRAGIDPLMEANCLGALLLQFPISFKNTPECRQYLFDLQRRFSAYPLVLEVRHSSWNDPLVLEALAELDIGFCNIDQPLLGKAIRPSAEATSAVGYVRLHGRNYKEWFAENRQPSDRYNYLYRMEQLEPWADRVRTINERTRSTYVVTNNHFEGKAVVNAFQLTALLTDKRIQPPEQLVTKYPQLKELTES
jgi:uncharacterized protein YecE (DUF72 family)